MAACASCGASLGAGARFCSACGALHDASPGWEEARATLRKERRAAGVVTVGVVILVPFVIGLLRGDASNDMRGFFVLLTLVATPIAAFLTWSWRLEKHVQVHVPLPRAASAAVRNALEPLRYAPKGIDGNVAHYGPSIGTGGMVRVAVHGASASVSGPGRVVGRVVRELESVHRAEAP